MDNNKEAPKKVDIRKRRGLTIKQRRLVANIVKGKSITEAALDSGYGTNRLSACVTGSQTLKLPHVQAAVQEALDKAGATIDASAKVIADAHKANTEGKFGKTLPDHDTLLKAVEANRKWRNIGTQDGSGINGDKLSIAILIMQEREKRGLPIPDVIEGEATNG